MHGTVRLSLQGFLLHRSVDRGEIVVKAPRLGNADVVDQVHGFHLDVETPQRGWPGADRSSRDKPTRQLGPFRGPVVLFFLIEGCRTPSFCRSVWYPPARRPTWPLTDEQTRSCRPPRHPSTTATEVGAPDEEESRG